MEKTVSCRNSKPIKNTGHALRFAHPLEYSTWNAMLYRCYNENDSCYYLYGGRGIKVCNRWRDFKLFVKDMGPRTSRDFVIDRIDNYGNYAPKNCRWVSKLESARNKRHIIKYKYQGERLNLKQIAELRGMKYATLWKRLYKYNWPIRKVLHKDVGRWTKNEKVN